MEQHAHARRPVHMMTLRSDARVACRWQRNRIRLQEIMLFFFSQLLCVVIILRAVFFKMLERIL
jgi:hypothetical protein